MNSKISTTPSPVAYPPNDQALFSGCFSGKLREFILGSCRSDALSAIRNSRLTDWVVDDSGATVEISGTRLVIKKQPTTDGAWITGTTPHGEFSLPKDHWIAQQVLRRLDRRTQGFALELRETAAKLFDGLAAEAREEISRPWRIVPEETYAITPMKPSSTDPSYGQRNFVFRTVGATELEKGFLATLHNTTWFGTRTEEQFLRERLLEEQFLTGQLTEELRRRERGYDCSVVREPWGIPRARPAGPYKDEFLDLNIHYAPLDRLRGVFGLERKDISVGEAYDTAKVKMIWINSGLGATH